MATWADVEVHLGLANLDVCCSMSQQQAVYHHQTVICYLDAAPVVIFIMRVTQHLEGYLKSAAKVPVAIECHVTHFEGSHCQTDPGIQA